MKKNKNDKGYTIMDLTLSVVVISLFTVIISLLFSKILKLNKDINYDSIATSYMVEILEGIDISNYEDVTTENVSNLIAAYDIPEKYTIEIQVDNYNDGSYIKIVTVTISYNVSGTEEEFSVRRLKIVEA